MQESVAPFSFPQHQWPPLPAALQRKGEALARLTADSYRSTGNQGFRQFREEAVKTVPRQASTNRTPNMVVGVSSTARTMTVEGGKPQWRPLYVCNERSLLVSVSRSEPQGTAPQRLLQCLALIISTNSGLREAPPTRKPSTSC